MVQKLIGTRETARQAPIGRHGRVKVALVTIIDEEFAETQKVFGLSERIEGTGYFVGAGREGDWDIALMQTTERGNVPAVNDVSNLMEDLRPQVLILIGIAGGLCTNGSGREGIAVGDVVIADKVSYVEFLKLSGGSAQMRSFPIDYPSSPLKKNVGMPLSKTFQLSAATTVPRPVAGNSKILIGEIVSGEKVMGDAKSALQQGLLKPFEKAIAIDMESIGMARAVCDGRTSFWYHPRYAIVRGISDLVDEGDNNSQRADWKQYAAHAAAVVAQQFVRMLPKDT